MEASEHEVVQCYHDVHCLPSSFFVGLVQVLLLVLQVGCHRHRRYCTFGQLRYEHEPLTQKKRCYYFNPGVTNFFQVQ